MAIAESGRHALTVESPTDLPVLITVSGRAVDVRAAVVADNSGAAVFADAPNRRMGVETLLIDVPHQRVIKVAIERNDHSQARGEVDVTVVGLPLTTESDQQRLQAAKLDAAGCLAFPDVPQGQGSAEAFESAAQLHEKNGDRLREGLARLHAAGARYTRLSDWAGAAELASQAAATLERADAPEHLAIAVRVEGAALDQRANATGVEVLAHERDLKRARERLTEAFERFQELGNSYEAGYALNYRGVSFHVAGESERARDDYRKALDLFRSAGDQPAQALALQSLALQSHEDGRLSDAMREFDEALALIPREEDPENYAHTLHNSAWPLRVFGRFDEAMARFHEAGAILRKRGDRDGEARALHGLGTTLLHAGEPERAAELLRAAIELRGESGARREQAMSLLLLGQIERETGQFQVALSTDRRGLALVQSPRDRAQAHLALARDSLAAGDAPTARQELTLILNLELPTTDRYLGLALTELGALEWLAGDSSAGKDHFARAIRIHEANGSELDYARTLQRRADLLLMHGDTGGAINDSGAAISLLDAIGVQSLQAESRAAFRASYRDAVEILIAALLAQAEAKRKSGDEAQAQQLLWSALEASDRARAQLVAGSTGQNTSAIPPQLLAQRREIYERLAGKRQQKDRMLESANPDTERVARLAREIELLRASAKLVEAQIAGTDATTTPRVVPVIRDRVTRFPPGAVLAEYFIGRSSSWLFAVRDGEISVHRLEPVANIERAARALHMNWRKSGRSADDRQAAGHALSQMLFRPLGETTPVGVLHVVPDGALHLLPMAVLAQQFWPQLPPGSVRISPALSLLLEGDTDTHKSADRMLAVIADPIYSVDDSRIRGSVSPTTHLVDAALTRSARSLSGLKRLPVTAIEAREILSLVGKREQTLALLGKDANRNGVVGAALDRFRIVHFATHAIADSQDPALATLVLSRWDETGKPIDGALRSYDIMQMRFNADLVVLSACDTALGREIAGEGPLGLANAFLRSGVQSVVATLWQVPDTSTAVLMREFYREMLSNGRIAPVALQLAQQHLRRQPRWSDPYYWAGFQLISIARLEAGNNNVERRGES